MRLLSLWSALALLGAASVVAAFDTAASVAEGKSLDEWIKALEDKQAKVRLQAATALGRLGFEARPAVPALIERLKDQDEMVCQAAARALSQVAGVPDLVRLLGHKDARVRRWGAFAIGDLRRVLGGMHPTSIVVDKFQSELKPAVPALIEALQDKNDKVQAEVVAALGAIGPPAKEAVPKITALLKHPDKLLRRTAASALWFIDGQDKVAVPMLIEGMQDKGTDRIDRKACVQVLGEIGAKAEAAVPALIELLRGIEKSRRTEISAELSFDACEALGRIGAPAVPALMKQLRDQDVDIRKHAVWALWRMGPQAKAAVAVLAEVSRDDNNDLRAFAVAALGKIGPAAGGAVPALIERLQDSDAKMRKSAAYALGSIGPAAKHAVAALIATLKDEEDPVRETAAWALGKIGPDAKAATPALIEAAKTDAHGLVAEALGRIGPEAKAAVPTLVTLLEQAQAPTRIKAALAHWRITANEKPAVTVLMAALMDDDSTVRCDAADALGEIGPKAKAAVPALIAMMQRAKVNNLYQERQAAREALRKIDPQAAKKPPKDK